MYLVDTNVISELPKRAPDPAVIAWFSAQESIALSVITIEEIAFGVGRAPPEQAKKLRPWFEKLLAIPPILVAIDKEVAHAAGRLRAALEQAGKVASQADMLIAASASRTGRILVTRNIKHFEGCGVPLLNPFSKPKPKAG